MGSSTLEFWKIPLLIAGGILAGYVNTLAGSGSLVTLPLLMFSGLPAHLANGTNRIAIFLQTVVANGKFYFEGLADVRGIILFGTPTLLGSLLGAQLAISMDEEMMRQAIGLLMVFMFFVVALRPKRWLTGRGRKPSGSLSFLHVVLLFVIGIYGGFIQAGVGIFLLAGLVLGVGYDLVRGNAVKVGIACLQTAAALLIFLKNQQVVWIPGLILAIGTMIGAWLGAKAASEKGANYVHRVLLIVVAVSALKILNVDDVIRPYLW